MEAIKYTLFYATLLAAIWGGGVLFANTVSTHEVIEPEQGVKCVVVSRMFNTSVDCWKD